MIQPARQSLRHQSPRDNSRLGPMTTSLRTLSLAILYGTSISLLDSASVFVGKLETGGCQQSHSYAALPCTAPHHNTTPYTAEPSMSLIFWRIGSASTSLGITPFLIPSDSSFLSVP